MILYLPTYMYYLSYYYYAIKYEWPWIHVYKYLSKCRNILLYLQINFIIKTRRSLCWNSNVLDKRSFVNQGIRVRQGGGHASAAHLRTNHFVRLLKSIVPLMVEFIVYSRNKKNFRIAITLIKLKFRSINLIVLKIELFSVNVLLTRLNEVLKWLHFEVQ